MMYFGDYTLIYNALPFPGWLLALVIIWTVPWKGAALWRAARNRQKIWFCILLVVNSLAILEILYLKFWQRKKDITEQNLGQNKQNGQSAPAEQKTAAQAE